MNFSLQQSDSYLKMVGFTRLKNKLQGIRNLWVTGSLMAATIFLLKNVKPHKTEAPLFAGSWIGPQRMIPLCLGTIDINAFV